LDATNTVTPLLSVLTTVAYDHMAYLGETLTEIAEEKAGILKPGVPGVVGPQLAEALQVMEAAGKRIGAPLIRYGREWRVGEEDGRVWYLGRGNPISLPELPLPGTHQFLNAGTALAAFEALTGNALTPRAVEALRHAQWPARLQRLKTGPLAELAGEGVEVRLDGGHNPAAGEILARWVAERGEPFSLICGFMRDKDMAGFLKPLAALKPEMLAAVPVVEDAPRAAEPELVAEEARKVGIRSVAAGDTREAIRRILTDAPRSRLILICGSLYLAGHVLRENG
jgi:dihydrofolate synthase/folylpolyglutamate synthase